MTRLTLLQVNRLKNLERYNKSVRKMANLGTDALKGYKLAGRSNPDLPPPAEEAE